MRLVLEVHFILVANLEGAKDSASMKTNGENEREEGERKGKKMEKWRRKEITSFFAASSAALSVGRCSRFVLNQMFFFNFGQI